MFEQCAVLNDFKSLHGRDRQICGMALKRGLRVFQDGCAWRVVGNGVDVSVSRLSNLTDSDLLPYRGDTSGKK